MLLAVLRRGYAGCGSDDGPVEVLLAAEGEGWQTRTRGVDGPDEASTRASARERAWGSLWEDRGRASHWRAGVRWAVGGVFLRVALGAEAGMASI